MKQTIADVERPLSMIPASALCGGAAYHLLGLFFFRLRVTGTIRAARLVATVRACAATPVVLIVPAIATMAIVSSVLVGLAAYETFCPDRFRTDARRASNNHST